MIVPAVEVAMDVMHPVELNLQPAGQAIVGALLQTALSLGCRLQITCGSNNHPPDDPHTTGEAIDVRSHGMDDLTKKHVVRQMLLFLSDGSGIDAPMETSGGLATTRFFGFLEAAGTPNEHFHFQLRKGTVYKA